MYSNLAKERVEQGFNIEDMAKVIGKSPCNYFKKETGQVKVSVSEALLISKFLKKKVDYLFFEDNVSENEILGAMQT